MQKNYLETEARRKAADIIKDAETCFFITQFSGTSRPMATTRFDEEGVIWFFTDINSRKVKDIKSDTEVRLLYAHPGKSKFLDLQGEAELITDRSIIKELWNPVIKAWFPEGVDDPDLCLIRILPFSAYYWDAESAKMIQMVKIAASIVTGKSLAEGKEGELSF